MARKESVTEQEAQSVPLEGSNSKRPQADENEPKQDGNTQSKTTSSNSTSSSSGNDSPIPTIGGPKKPAISKPTNMLNGAQDLQARLASFLPQLAAANADLATTQNMEDVEDGQQHIEMDLGLGVLEERDGSSSSSEESSSEEESDEEMSDAEEGASHAKPGKKDVMDKLMGQKTEKKAAIEEVG